MKPFHSVWPQLNRRGFLITGATALALKGSASTPSCVLMSEQEEGPYYVSGAKLRRGITEGRPGVPVVLRVTLLDAKRCTPLTKAALDIWHCDAAGVYSGFTANRGGGLGGDPGRGRPMPSLGPGGRGARTIDETRFLRGVQMTNEQGVVEFATLYPGWYQGRAIHIHLKVHLGGEASETYSGGHVSHTGQLFFPEDVTERIARMTPYASRVNVHRTTQEEDHVFRSQQGGSSMVRLERMENRSDSAGFVASVTIAADPEATPRLVGAGGGRRDPGGPPPIDR